MKNKFLITSLLCGSCICFLLACINKKKHTAPKQKQIVANIKQLDEVISESIAERLSALRDNEGELEDSIQAFRPEAIATFYGDDKPSSHWSKNGNASPMIDSMLFMIQHADEAGLMPEQYHSVALSAAWNQLNTDPSAKKDAALWAKVDVLMTDAFMKMASDLRFGVAPRDSVSLKKDSLFTNDQLIAQLQSALQNQDVSSQLHALEPSHAGYLALKEAIVSFKAKYQDLHWDTLPLNYTDTVAFRQLVMNRLVQSKHLDTTGGNTDSTALKAGIKAFQKEFNIYPDGIAGKRTVMALNRTARDWVVQAGINLDRWRKLPDTLPDTYIMVNLPGYTLRVMDSGNVALESRVIVGTPRTRTPILNSYMTNFMMYPYWRVPYSIVFKEMLPAIQKNIGYLASKNLEVIDKDGNTVDPSTINWSKLSKGHFPYVLRQMDGLDNSLGIMKFNFRNKYSVYLHDTNNRGLFKNSMRAMSHGCVRVQQWDSLAQFLVRTDTLSHKGDSVRAWLAREEKRQVDLPKHIPIYLRYFTAEGQNGTLVFFDDIYGEDRILKKHMHFN
ncbi:Murein L,D-transpeptidase YcbB/YkuD [Chitinophaga terrae (ex Kim and Jung 2007)]|jgi:murein L,D-transpeptidase YcbB/YkuD|uniref:Murein L,D-transpeptidase YcbB/YkuD n=1 Tax=Chitinophaga terrae (ex Kim and Jung 2007) TaxID=408074 RepID=A0A1H4E588_9BACT|nr:L,D-transpeptidase family protein [Chitinophaga terrae (ex Kim and Jung 2007)]MDQ0108300.1 murein L,D-transpeptidase YcbB/YkuD [Chitinophaga terrae (ex Kim and Jung 2007)]GEP91396.1 peptidoglycan-binding protein [Chitinophaga terrae (ex Kim and Jung 2007)]SEA79997.1 Murein L,D-transpeptidase YcbB/YkuD [Chitinophaga terrae (ex Kim and Jung 2007)]